MTISRDAEYTIHNIGLARQPSRVRRATRELFGFTVLFLAFHVLVGVIIHNVPEMATVHAAVTIAVGLVIALSRAPLHRMAYVAAYIVGSEVLWRMGGAQVYWEVGKYATIFVLFIGLFRAKAFRLPVLPTLFFLMLLPSAAWVIRESGLTEARDALSFVLSGPAALVICAWFFSSQRVESRRLQRILLYALAPIIAIATIALSSILQAPNIEWVLESNFQASGGFGPNQVSDALGLGVLAVWIIVMVTPMKFMERIVLLGVGIWLLIQTFLTFSRGGMINAVVAGTFLTVHILIDQRRRPGVILLIIIAAVFSVTVVFPWLNVYTGGALAERYADAETTGRDVLFLADLQVFAQNPLWGVGVGRSPEARLKLMGARIATHTEYSRLLAEHGIMGVLALALLFGMGLVNYLRMSTLTAKGVVVAFLVWGYLFMSHSATRTAMPSFLIGFTFAQFNLFTAPLPSRSQLQRTVFLLSTQGGEQAPPGNLLPRGPEAP